MENLNLLLPLDIQYFANDNTNDGVAGESETNIETDNDTTNSTDTDTKVDNKDKKKSESVDNTESKGESVDNTESETITIDMVQKMIQSETDKVRTEYVKKLKQKEQEIEDVKKSSMSETERLDYENKTLQEQLDERERTLKEREQAFARTELELKSLELLEQHSLPHEAKQFLVGTDEVVTKSNILAFKVMFDSAIENAIKERIKGTTKEHRESFSSSAVTKDNFEKMKYSERIKLLNSNPELYKELSK